MARTPTEVKQAPRGTNVLKKAFLERIAGQPKRLQREAGIAALQAALIEVKAMPRWQDPKELQAAKKPVKKPGKPGKGKASAPATTTRAARKAAGTSTTRKTRRPRSDDASAEQNSTSVNGAANPDQASAS